MTLTIPERARRYLAKCPVAISGQHGHDTTFRVASVLWNGFALSETETLAVLREWNERCVPPWTEAELIHKVTSVANASHQDARGHLLGADARPGIATGGGVSRPIPLARKPAKPAFQPMVLKRIAAKTAHFGDPVPFIMARSAGAVESADSAGVLRYLYPKGSGEKVLVFNKMESQGQYLWEADRSDRLLNSALPKGGDGVWFLPQPVDGVYHPNPRLNGKPSRRSEESVTAWRYVLLESDEAEPVDWLRCLIQLPLRIVSVCESGGRSIHALVRLDASSKADWDARVATVKRVLVTLGACSGSLSAVRLSRLPQAMRGARCQRLLYLNNQADGLPLVRQEPRQVTTFSK